LRPPPLVPLASLTATADPAKPFVQGTETVAAYDYDNAIHERVEVEVPSVDGDANGIKDRVTVDLIRPGEAAQAGIDVPVIIQASPYYAGDSKRYFEQVVAAPPTHRRDQQPQHGGPDLEGRTVRQPPGPARAGHRSGRTDAPIHRSIAIADESTGAGGTRAMRGDQRDAMDSLTIHGNSPCAARVPLSRVRCIHVVHLQQR
jgi:hypothetical protein